MASLFDIGRIPTPPDPERQRWDGNDVLQSFRSGLASGASQLTGLPGDIRSATRGLADMFLNPIERRLGYQGPTQEEMDRRYASLPSILPTSQTMRPIVGAVFGSPHQPQTHIGTLAQRIGEAITLAPASILMRRF